MITQVMAPDSLETSDAFSASHGGLLLSGIGLHCCVIVEYPTLAPGSTMLTVNDAISPTSFTVLVESDSGDRAIPLRNSVMGTVDNSGLAAIFSTGEKIAPGVYRLTIRNETLAISYTQDFFV